MLRHTPPGDTTAGRPGQRGGDVNRDSEVICCDALGCRETHPVRHEALGRPGFGIGRWLGWVYLDLNRPDLRADPLRFCSTWCLRWWLNSVEENAGRKPAGYLDAFLRNPATPDELAARRTGVAAKHEGEVS